ncbi:hypothetical protein FB567DRAFT_565070 [Paraphoma chrysanthemicola]|uniref:PH domain-containing protein n=1 Tax=Paraphoma chrysanthemicola TaxID=798071 RepID=A0A8K0VRM0_9PLEO|nr:hypothetical protein FB567DRAFT_565070 [Paraphoma chrysanthemicola]
MIQTYQPPVMEVGKDTLPELQRIFTFLNSHSNKLYQEGYFLKFHDTDARGRPAPDRKWQEYFVQLVGTILSLWDATDLDHAGGDMEVLPTFINLTDAAIHMIPSMTLKDGKKLDNILSVSTAASNKYLFHFDSFHALTQWTAGIRLAMYEQTCLSEAYTGALIAGKGKQLNNIRSILDRQHAVYEDWVRVRFGAGTPWRRCWCVVSPPDQKEIAKLQKSAKKSNVYDRPAVLKGDIKFYDTKKIKKTTKPIATVKNAFACYAIYPQSKQLIDQSTLMKIEGKITVHSSPESTTDGFVFVMPEARPAITGFEIMLQYLFPVYDTFNLYGRPNKLVADVLDARGLMFAMPADRRYGYLEIWDVVNLINTDGSQTWSERQWRKQLKDLTAKKMSEGMDSDVGSFRASRRNTVSRAGFTPSRSNLRFDESGSIRSNPSTRRSSPTRHAQFEVGPGPRRVGTAPAAGPFAPPRHQRSVSEANGYNNYQSAPTRFVQEQMADQPPTPPPHGVINGQPQNGQYREASDSDESPIHDPSILPQLPVGPSVPPHGPVDVPPAHAHATYQQPPVRPALPPAMKPNAAVDSATLHQMADATNTPLPAGIAAAGAAAAWKSQESFHSQRSGEYNGYDNYAQQPYLNARPPPTDRNSGSRLATIPASPYSEQSEFMQRPDAYQPTAPPVPEHAEPSQQSKRELPYRPHSGSGSGNIARKPVPGRSPSTSQEVDTRSITSSTHDSLQEIRGIVVDTAALDSLQRQQSSSSSRYDEDNASSATPDYASVASEEIKPRKLPERREDRPRSGILKVAGDPNLKLKEDMNAAELAEQINIPEVDFGRTYELDFKRPGTSGTMTQAAHDGNSRSRENLATTPTDQLRHSYISGRTTPNAALHMRSESNAQSQGESRSVAWNPAKTSPGRQGDQQGFDGEQWVRNRASQQPQGLVYGHGRTNSHTPPPLGGRQKSGDWTNGRPPSRPLSRPQSRGAEAIIEQHTKKLSAHEQMYNAQNAAAPMLSGVTGHKQKQPSEGLINFIDTREKQRQFAKDNHISSGSKVEARIYQKQHAQKLEAQARQREMQIQQQLQMQNAQGVYQGTPSVMGMSMGTPSVMGMPVGPGTPQGMVGMAYSSPQQLPPQMYQQGGYFQQPMMTPNTNMIPGGWVSPSPQTPQGQYFQQPMNFGQQPATQPYGASYDRAQAAKQAQQQGHQRW